MCCGVHGGCRCTDKAHGEVCFVGDDSDACVLRMADRCKLVLPLGDGEHRELWLLRRVDTFHAIDFFPEKYCALHPVHGKCLLFGNNCEEMNNIGYMNMVRRIISYTVYGIATMITLYMLWLIARVFIFDYFTVPSSSMTPTIQPGDKVIVNKLLFGPRIYTDFHFDAKGQQLQSFRLRGLRGIRHNDIIVFNFPVHDDRMSFRINHVYCKRVVGLPGDTVRAVNGYIVNNNYSGILGHEERQKQLRSKSEKDLRRYGVYDVAPRHTSEIRWNIQDWGPLYVPRKNDIITVTPREATIYKRILEWETGCKIRCDWSGKRVYADGKPFTHHRFRHDYFHLCGDYSLDSFDSRYWGFVPEEYVVGVVSCIF